MSKRGPAAVAAWGGGSRLADSAITPVSFAPHTYHSSDFASITLPFALQGPVLRVFALLLDGKPAGCRVRAVRQGCFRRHREVAGARAVVPSLHCTHRCSPLCRRSFLGRALTRPCWKSCVWCGADCCVLLARRSSRAAPQRWERKLKQSGIAPTVPAAAAAAAKAPSEPAQTVCQQKPAFRARSRVLRLCPTGACASSCRGTFCPCTGSLCIPTAAAAATATSVRTCSLTDFAQLTAVRTPQRPG